MKRLISDQEKELYRRDGYMLLDTEVSERVLDGIVADLLDRYDGGRRCDAWQISDNVRAMAVARKVLDLLEELYEAKPLPFQTLNFPVGTEQHPHSDTVHFNSIPRGMMCGIWVALEDIDLDNGPLVYYPGSHLLPDVTRDLVDSVYPPGSVDPSVDDFPPRHRRFISERIEREELKPSYATMGKGQALLWAANLLHGGARVRDRSRTRHSQVTHYFFEGCKYYTPFFSKGDQVQWRDPVWITPKYVSKSHAEEPSGLEAT